MISRELIGIITFAGISGSLLITVCFGILIHRRKLFYFNLNGWLEKRDGKKITILLISLAFITRAPSLFMLTDTDESVYILMSKLVYGGEGLYSDFFTVQPPAYFISTAFLFKIFGVGILQAKILPFLFSIATVLLIHHITKGVYGVKAGLMSLYASSISTGLVALTRNALLYSECVFFSTLSAYFFINSLKDYRDKKVFLAGFFASLATLFRFFGLFVLAAILVHTVLSRRRVFRTAIIILSGFITPLIPVLLAFGPKQIMGILTYSALKLPVASLPERLSGLATYSIVLYSLPILLGILGAYSLYSMKRIGGIERFLFLWVFVVLVGVLGVSQVLPMVYAYYFVLAVPALAIIAGNSVYSQESSLITLLAVFSFVSLILNAVLVLADVDFFSRQLEVSEYITRSTPQETLVTGSFPDAQAVSFLSGKKMFLDVVETGLRFNASHTNPNVFYRELLARPAVVVLKDEDPNPDVDSLRSVAEEKCRLIVRKTDETVFYCGAP